ncbi:MAG: hypothetical protein Q4G09_00390 [Clostridia bacterium]|nr:hypothetical protein [Clostridia bacterium]
MEEEIKKYKKYIYISDKINPFIEDTCKRLEISLLTRFINQYNLENFLQSELKNLNNIDYLIIDYNSIKNQTKENDIVTAISRIRRMYEIRIIFILEGATKGNILLGRLFNLGIYNIISATNDVLFKEELQKSLSEKGMSFANAVKYQLDKNIFAINNNTNVIKETYVKVKQLVTVAVCSTERHLGATTQAINITKFLSELLNIKVCYIENNNHNSIIEIFNTANKDEATYYEETGKIEYEGIEMFMKSNIAEIMSSNYDFYVFDFGSMEEMTDNDINSFLTKDIKFIISGTKAWELRNLFESFEKIGKDKSINFIFNFTAKDKRSFFKENMGEYKEKTFFSEYIDNPFIVGNKIYWENIFKPFILNCNIEEIDKKRTWLNKFKKRIKNNEQ